MIMAQYQNAATFCEVTYDSDWYGDDYDDRYLTPYRYSLYRTESDSNSDTVSLTLPSFTYYEYLRELYDCRASTAHGHRVPHGYPGSSHSGVEPPVRAGTWHDFGKEPRADQAGRPAHSEPPKTRPTYQFPTLHFIQQRQGASDDYEDVPPTDRTRDKLVWVDSLDKWVQETQLQHRPYMSFVANPPVVDKPHHMKTPRESVGAGDKSETCPCARFELHMGLRSTAKPSDKLTNKQRNEDKRDAIRKRAQEMAEQRRQRKAYSTPLYTSLTERKQKARGLSSKVPASTPVSPRHREKAPTPQEVVQREERKYGDVPVTPIKREITVKLVSPKPDDVDKEADKKVTFIDSGQDKAAKKKPKQKKGGKRRKGKAEKTQKVKTVKPAKTKVKKEKEKSEEKLPITTPDEVEEIPEEKPKSPQPRRRSVVRQIVKKERRERVCVKEEPKEPEPPPPPPPEVVVKTESSWIFGADDFSETTGVVEKRPVEVEPVPSFIGDLNPELLEKKKQARETRRTSVIAKLIHTENAVRRWKKPARRDSSYQDELQRMELAEERRRRQIMMYDRLKNRRMSIFGQGADRGLHSFEDYGFLAKYCIFNKVTMDMYRHAFDAVDEYHSGFLEGEDVMIALRGVNNRLTEAEEEYIYRVLELTGYKLTNGADFKMFSVLAALSQRVTALDKWMKNMIGNMDFKTLEMKMFMCKTLWECNVDKETNKISLDQVCVDLRAGGVSFEHELEVRDKLSHLTALDLLDFLTYVPLFIMIHESVVQNPLDDSRDK